MLATCVGETVSIKNDLISICIVTYNRPKLLKEAIQSCLDQTYRPIEIVICDDSKDNLSEKGVEDMKLKCDSRCKIRYEHNNPSLGQAGNVNKCFSMAKGDRLVLLHDDDLLLPNALSDLSKCWEIIPDLTLAYGKRYNINMDGTVIKKDTLSKNGFSITTDKSGLRESSLKFAIYDPLPPNGYMVLSSAAKSVKWRSREEVGEACDFDFGVRLASKYKKFYFINDYVSKYRLSDESISKSYDGSFEFDIFNILDRMTVPNPVAHVRKFSMTLTAQGAVLQHIKLGEKKKALNIYLSQYYPLKKRFGLKGIYHLLLIILPNFIACRIINFRKFVKNRLKKL